jgi:hypothetical protein
MSQLYAREYGEILVILPQNEELRTAITTLIAREPIASKIMEGAGRSSASAPSSRPWLTAISPWAKSIAKPKSI